MGARGESSRQGLGLALLLALLAGGCTRWRTISIPSESLLVAREPDRIRVTRSDGRRVVLRRPVLIRDTVVDGRLDPRMPERRVPLSDVSRIEVRRWDPIGTTVIVVGLAAIASAYYIMLRIVSPPG